MGLAVKSLEVARAVAWPAGTDFLSASRGNRANMEFCLGAPCFERQTFTTTQKGRGCAYVGNLDGSTQFINDHYAGFDVDIFVVRNGRRVLWHSDTVTGSMCYPITCKRDLITATTYQFSFDTTHKTHTSYWLGIAAVDASDDFGPVTWIEYAGGDPLPVGSTTHTTYGTRNSDPGEITSLDAPTGLAAVYNATNDTVDVSYDAVAGASGYVGFILYQDPTVSSQDEYIELSNTSKVIPAGAHVIVKGLRASKPSGSVCPRIWGSASVPNNFRINGIEGWKFTDTGNPTWTAYAGDGPADVDGDYFLRNDNPVLVNAVTHSGTLDTFYDKWETGRTFRTRFLMRVPPGHADQTLSVMHAGTSLVAGSDTVTVTTSWQWFEQDWTVTAQEDDTSTNTLMVNGNTGTVDIAAIEMFDITDDTVSKHDLPPSWKSRVAPAMYFRDHGHIKGRPTTADDVALTNLTGHTPRGPASLYTLFRQCQINGLKPWLQLEWSLQHNEWLNILAYIAAPVSSGHAMALKRQAQGQTEPWTHVFPDMLLEISNETWLSSGDFWTAPGNITDIVTGAEYTRGAYSGLMYRQICDWLEASPYWPAFRSTCKMITGGHIASNHGAKADERYRQSDLVVLAAYNRGWENGAADVAETQADFEELLGYAGNETRWALRQGEVTTGRSFGSYEFASGYNIVGTTNAARIPQDIVMKSRAAMTAQIDAVATRGALGYQLECYFLLGEGWRWSTHNYATDGGGTNLDWTMLKLLYEHVGPSEITAIPHTNSSTRVDAVPAIAAWEFKSVADPSKRAYVVVNRNVDPGLFGGTSGGTEAVSINTGLASATSLDYFANCGNHREHNRWPVGQRLDMPSATKSTWGLVPDPLCVAFPETWSAGSVPGDLSSVTINDAFGADASGLQAGCCVLLKLAGCVGV